MATHFSSILRRQCSHHSSITRSSLLYLTSSTTTTTTSSLFPLLPKRFSSTSSSSNEKNINSNTNNNNNINNNNNNNNNNTERNNLVEMMKKNMEKLEQIQNHNKKLEKVVKRQQRRFFIFGILWILPTIFTLLFLHTLRKRRNAQAEQQKMAKKVIQISTSSITDLSSEIGSLLLDEDTISFANLIELLRKAATDKSVLGVSLILEDSTIGLAKTQEILEELRELRKKGKFVMAYGKEISLRDFILASCCDRIALQPTAVVNVCGLAFPGVFFKGMLEKLGIVPFVVKREKYKSAMEPLITDSFSKEYREEMESLGQDLHRQYLFFISERLNISLEEAQKIVDNAPYITDEAIAKGLADVELDWDGYETELSKMCYNRDDVSKSEEILYVSPREYIKTTKGSERWRKTLQLLQDTRYEGASEYSNDRSLPASDEKEKENEQEKKQEQEKELEKDEKEIKKPKIIALINITGAIRGGESDGMESGSDTVEKLIKTAAAAPHVVGIVLRIDSPGGDAIASESIWNAVMQARKSKKPIVASMGDVCASGGYYVASATDRIVALPATITGSIGVIMGSFSVSKLLEKVGITHEMIKFGENSDYMNIFEYPSQKAQERTNVVIDKMYDIFLTRVSQGRDMSKEEVREIAQGRVWTGRQGLDNGLVDELGGLYQAKQICEALANVEPTEEVKLVKFAGRAEAMFDLFDLWSDIGLVSRVFHPAHKYMTVFNRLNYLLKETQFRHKPQYLWSPFPMTTETIA